MAREVVVQVRQACRDDVAAIQAIGRTTWPTTYAFAGEDYIVHGLAMWWSVEALLHSLEVTTCLVADDGDGLVGMGNIDLRSEVPTMWRLYVLPEVQGTGVGSALMTALIARVPPGTPRVRLEYADGNDRTARFYASKQFTEIRREPGERPGWPVTVWVERTLATGKADAD